MNMRHDLTWWESDDVEGWKLNNWKDSVKAHVQDECLKRQIWRQLVSKLLEGGSNLFDSKETPLI